MTSFTITVTWRVVPCTVQNGEISGYLVSYDDVQSDKLLSSTAEDSNSIDNTTTSAKQPVRCRSGSGSGSEDVLDKDYVVNNGSESNLENKSVLVTELQATLTGLRPSTNYSITVAAINGAGVGEQSDTLYVETSRKLSKCCECILYGWVFTLYRSFIC